MKIFGYPNLPSPNFKQITAIQDIDSVLPNFIIWWKSEQDKNLELANFCHKHQINYAVYINEIIELLVYANLGVKYLITSRDQAPEFQQVLKEYLLDPILLSVIKTSQEIHQLALQGIDGVIFENKLYFA